MRLFAVLVAASAVSALAACEVAAGPGPVPSWTGSPGTAPAPDEVVLRWRLTGGIAGIGGRGELPDFSLYGDGRAIVAGPDPLRPREYRLTGPRLRQVIDEAHAAGLSRARQVDSSQVADAFVLNITFAATTSRITLWDGTDGDPAVRLHRRVDPRSTPAGLPWTSGGTFAFTRLAVLATRSPGGGPVRRWPLAPLGADGACSVLSGGDLRRAVRLAGTAPAGVRWVSGGTAYALRWRPLLPDEGGCAGLTRR